MIVTPVISSPASIERSIGAAPARQQRRMDVQHRMLGEERLLDERAERADQDLVGLRGGDPLAPRVGVDRLRLEHLDAQFLRSDRHRWRLQLAAASLRPVGPRDYERRGMRARGHPSQDGDRELRRAHEDGPHRTDLIDANVTEGSDPVPAEGSDPVPAPY
jgi:hypothetical protein